MSFSKAKTKRFNEEVVGCGPPPTKYDPRFPAGPGAASFGKGERFLKVPPPNETTPLARSHSSSSVGSTDSLSSTKTGSQAKQDHTQCNKQIADLEKKLSILTLERNQLFKRRDQPQIPDAEQSSVEVESEADVVDEGQSDKVMQLTARIEDLEAKLEEAKLIEAEKEKLESERVAVLVDLHAKKNEILKINEEIQAIKASYVTSEDRFKTERQERQRVSEEMKQLENEMVAVKARLEHVEKERVAKEEQLVQKISSAEQNLCNVEEDHRARVEKLTAEHVRKVLLLENNLQQLAEEHDAETEQNKYEYARQVEELSAVHAQAVTEMANQHSARIAEVSATHKEEVDAIKAASGVLSGEKLALQEKLTELAASLEAKNQLVESLRMDLDGARKEIKINEQQAAESFEEMKKSLEIRIVEVKVDLERQHLANQVALKADFESKKSVLEEESKRVLEQLDEKLEKLAQLEKRLEETQKQHEEQLERLEKNNQTEKEILVWQLNQEKANLEQELKSQLAECVAAKQAEIDRCNVDWETKLNETKLGYDNEAQYLVSEHNVRLEKERAVYEEAMDVLKKDRANVIQSYEESLAGLRKSVQDKDDAVGVLQEKMDKLHATFREDLEEKSSDIARLEADWTARLEAMSADHQAQLMELHKSYERVIIDMEVKFASERGVLVAAQEKEVAAIKSDSEREMKAVQDDFRKTFEMLQKQMCDEKAEMAKLHQKEIGNLNENHEEMLSLAQQEHDLIVQEIRRNCEESAANVDGLREQIEAIGKQYQADISAWEERENSLFDQVEKLQGEISAKNRQVCDLKETLELREKQTADEWIQRETGLFAQFSTESKIAEDRYKAELKNAEDDRKNLADQLAHVTRERDTALEEIEMFQIKLDTQRSAMDEEHEEECSLLRHKWAEQSRQVSEIHVREVSEMRDVMEMVRKENSTLKERLEHMEYEYRIREESVIREHNAAAKLSVRQALMSVEQEMSVLKKEHDDYVLLQQKYKELLARIEPFAEQLEMYETEKNALLNQALFAENSMVTLTSKYTQLLGHQNNKQKIHHLDKLKQDIFNLRKELNESRLALEKEKKLRLKAEGKLKELTGQRKYDPSEAFKVPDVPAIPSSSVIQAPKSAVLSSAKTSGKTTPQPCEKEPRVKAERKPLRSQPKGAFFLSMAEVEAERLRMEEDKQRQIQERRENSHSFDAFTVDFEPSRRDTFDVPPRVSVTRSNSDKENSRHFPSDISEISMAEDVLAKNKGAARSDVMTSTPLQRH